MSLSFITTIFASIYSAAGFRLMGYSRAFPQLGWPSIEEEPFKKWCREDRLDSPRCLTIEAMWLIIR